MLISRIEPVTKERSRVFLDTGESFVLYKGEIRLLGIKEGRELGETNYNQIMNTVLPRRAKLRAMNLLKSKDYTEYQLRNKLSDAGYPEHIVDIALNYVKSYDYVNDFRYACEYIREHIDFKSRKEILLKLTQRGIERTVSEHAFLEICGDERESDDLGKSVEDEIIRKALVKKKYTGEEPYEERQKILAYFYRRGFDMERVYKVMDSFGNC